MGQVQKTGVVISCLTLIRLMPILIFLFLSLLLGGCATGVYHTVKPGQTLYRISKTYGVDEAYLARINLVRDPTQIKAGSRLYIPGAERVRYVPVVTKKKTSQATSSRKTKRTTTAKTTTKKRKATKATKNKQKTTKASSTKSTATKKKVTRKKSSSSTKATTVKRLRWPLRGKIVRSFSNKATTGGGKGIEIAVKSGSSVVAAEAGKVIYSGDGVNGYGHLVILQHENDLFTVYGFNRRNIVRQGDFVSKGEKIAYSGVPPAGGQPRLHFEVRKGKQAVNPILYLP